MWGINFCVKLQDASLLKSWFYFSDTCELHVSLAKIRHLEFFVLQFKAIKQQNLRFNYLHKIEILATIVVNSVFNL